MLKVSALFPAEKSAGHGNRVEACREIVLRDARKSLRRDDSP